MLVLTSSVLAGYLVGGIPFGYLVGRWRGIDIFQHGSGNIGATNVGRVLGRRYGILVFVLDFTKGAIAAGAGLLIRDVLDSSGPERLMREGLGVWAGLAAFLGHLFPVYLRFRGGKGVATGAGVISVLLPVPALGALLTWLGVVCGSRYVSLASLTAALALCFLQATITPQPFQGTNLVTTCFCFVAGGLVIFRHRANISRLIQGNENRLPETSAMLQFTNTIHVLALGLWFGGAAFFLLVVAGSVFRTFDAVSTRDSDRSWFPLAEGFKRRDTAHGGSLEIDGWREQGSRAAGAVVAPLFLWFFLWQGTCGFLAVTTSLGWSRSRPQEKAHRWRSGLLLAALVTVLVGWPIERHVAELRVPRNLTTDQYLQSPPESASAAQAAMEAARGEFGRWHFYSLGLSMVTLLLVAAAMALAARLPASENPCSLSSNPEQNRPSAG